MSVVATLGRPPQTLWDLTSNVFVLHFAFMDGCAACLATKPIVEQLEARYRGRLEVRRYNAQYLEGLPPERQFPGSIETVPALVLTLGNLPPEVRPAPKAMPTLEAIDGWLRSASGRLSATRERMRREGWR